MRATKQGRLNRAAQGGSPGVQPRAPVPRRHTVFAQTARGRWRTFALGLFALALLVTALWLRWPESSRPTLVGLLGAAEHWRSAPFAPLLALAGFAFGGLIVFPVNLLTAATILVFGPLAGGVYALLGCVLSAALVYEIGHRLPARVFARVAGARGERLRQRAIGHGVLAVALLRIVPVAPYSVVGYVAGAARIHRGDYLAGTALGMAPGVVLYALFVDRARAVLLDPHPLAWLALVAAIGLIVTAALVARARRATQDDP